MEKSSQLILNPVENLPYLITQNTNQKSRGLYVSDKIKNDEVVRSSKIGFSGRQDYNEQVQQIYSVWKQVMGASTFSMRLLSGLHAHIIIFMGIGNIGDKVLLLPEAAGGHYATKGILERLGYHVLEMAIDYEHYCINVPATIQIMKQEKPNFIFVDRSEGINYEDFSKLLNHADKNICSIFDASQYITNIVFGDLPSPFEMGFDIILSTLHKNFPGPQKAFVCSKEDSIYWKKVQKGMYDYVSSLHIENLLFAGDVLKQQQILKKYSREMLINSIQLERELTKQGLPVVEKNSDVPPTHHTWIRIDNPNQAFQFYKEMEACDILVNYRRLPYDLGYGIRMGTAAATLQGLNGTNIKDLSNIISSIYFRQLSTEDLKTAASHFISSLTPLTVSIEPQLDNRKQYL